MDDTRSKEDKEYVAGLEKGLAVIEAFGLSGGALTLSEAAEITGHSRASARRSLLTLQRLGYVHAEGKYFRLAPRTLRLGHAYVVSNPLGRLVQPILEATTERTHESSSVAVLDGMEAVFVARATARRSLSNGLGMGSRLPAHSAATGRVLLSELPDDEIERRLRMVPLRKLTPRTLTDPEELSRTIRQVRVDGYAVCNEELELGVRSIAVPLQDHHGRVIAALSLVSAMPRMSTEMIVETLLPHLESARRMLATVL
ncbi:helix-turn-helix domain-containing protein [Verticiella sediminum]|uniref:Helix-turn-helix domain-containing protein n=1 Tax=Verticiella sediminum TaxID=1247510 RepID=A0A556B1J3_9BURK|nr:IclR family transcriptional regulator C-terminal domain-containing protein [Verticiella sediminum]TSH98605.1 helix-turn-helix domain-containing protein [Verticiella sediminum]